MRSYLSVIIATAALSLVLVTCNGGSPTGGGSGGENGGGTNTESFSLTIENSPSQAGSVIAAPDLSSYSDGDTVSLQASSNTGWMFESWSEDGSVLTTDNPYTITMDSDKTITANFTEGPGEFQNELTITNGNKSKVVHFGLLEHSEVKQGLDGNDVEAPPVGPPEAFFTGFKHEVMVLYEDYRPLPNDYSDTIIWELQLNRPQSSNMILEWAFNNTIDNENVSLQMVDNPDSATTTVNIDMLSQTTYGLTDPGIQRLYIVYSVSVPKQLIIAGKDKTDDVDDIIDETKEDEWSRDFEPKGKKGPKIIKQQN